MNMLTRSAATAILALTLAPLTGAAAPPPGKPAPDVTFQTAQGTASRLTEHKGHVTLVDFWASWCEPCKKSFPALDTLSRQLQPRGLDVLAVNLDERRRDADAFLNARLHTMTILFDPKGAAPQAFGVQGMPSSFLIDRAGVIRFTHMGYSGDVEEQYRREILQLLSEPQS
jgi:thiol-disulfide isomerase/thioredoxin